jgi:hypothetical protein
MKTAVVFRHVPFEDLDSLGETLLAKGYRWRYIDTPVQSLSALDPLADDVLIVLGGRLAFTNSLFILSSRLKCGSSVSVLPTVNRFWVSAWALN